jgi:hypothetical protein
MINIHQTCIYIDEYAYTYSYTHKYAWKNIYLDEYVCIYVYTGEYKLIERLYYCNVTAKCVVQY